MKIVHIITRFIRGGADENTLLTCNGQADLGHEVTLIFGREHHADMVARLSPKVTAIAMDSLVRSIHPVKDTLCLFDLIKRMRAIRPDIVHTHESKAGIIGRLAGRFTGVPLIIHGVHILSFAEAPFPASLVFRLLEQLAGTMTDAYINVSKAMMDTGLNAHLGRPEQHFVVESGMIVSDYALAKPANWRQDPLLNSIEVDQPIFLLASGTLEPRKRIDDFIRLVFSQIARENPDSILLIAGDGIERQRIDATIAELNLSHRVFLLGHQTNLQRYISLADICIHAAMREGLPRVVVQYAIAGKPIVTTALPGIDQLVTTGQNGVITPIAGVDNMLEPLRRVLGDLGGFAARGKARGQSQDFSNWDHSKMVSRLETIYKQVMAEKRAKSPEEHLSAEPKGKAG